MVSKKRKRRSSRRTYVAPLVALIDRAGAKRAHREEAWRRREAIERSVRRRRLARRAITVGPPRGTDTIHKPLAGPFCVAVQ